LLDLESLEKVGSLVRVDEVDLEGRMVPPALENLSKEALHLSTPPARLRLKDDQQRTN
jgi:hypothetical protein